MSPKGSNFNNLKPNVPQVPQAVPSGSRFFGVYPGVVNGVADPLQQGRLFLTIPALGIGPVWALSCTTAGHVGGKAVVAFLGGSPDQPVVLGFVP
jgi:hypothetical protein